ncbi:hypothetical protein [Tateyamaria sp.]|uniref:hypothetical protein n=1 Tax=Tateyamaria sp. TaxID=1929288 RepID=UPI003B20E046
MKGLTMAHALQIDTLKLADDLEAAKGDPKQTARVISKTIGTIDISELATKADLGEVKTELKAEIAGLDVKIGDVKADVRAVTDKLGTMATKAELGDVKADILKWMFGAIIAQTGIILAVVKLL